jgi:hypothetical protein
MAGLVPAIHALFALEKLDVDARDKRGHDDVEEVACCARAFSNSLESSPLQPWLWFETREDALLTMRVRNLILRSGHLAASRRMKPLDRKIL